MLPGRMWIAGASANACGCTTPNGAGVGFELGAGLGIPVMTAHRCLFSDGSLSGATVLVDGGKAGTRVEQVDSHLFSTWSPVSPAAGTSGPTAARRKVAKRMRS